MKQKYLYGITALMLIIGVLTYYIKEQSRDYGHKVVVCVPVYGQSLALGEEAVRITNCIVCLHRKRSSQIILHRIAYRLQSPLCCQWRTDEERKQTWSKRQSSRFSPT